MAQLTVDLGNYNTIVTFRELGEAAKGLLHGVAREVQEFPGVLFIPSLVHLGETILLGEEVLRTGLYEDPGAFRDLKDHVVHAAPVARNVGGRRITHKGAAATFLAELVRRLRAELGQSLEVVLLFPNASADSYREWLRSVDFGAAASVTLVDEDTAVALGYGLNLFVDDLVMIFDFGFSSLRARVAHFHWMGREAYTRPAIKASASLPVGTADLKQKILRELHTDASEEQLPAFYWKKFTLHGDGGESLSDERFRELLERENLAAHVQRVIERAYEEASLGGVRPRDIRKVLLVGGGTRIPIVRRILDENFGDRVLGDLPELAAGRGGIEFLADSPIDDMVRQTYSMQVRDPITGEYSYPVVVEKFTRFPTRSPTARYIVNTYYDGQYELHMKLFRTVNPGEAESREILFGQDRKMSFVTSRTEEVHEAVGHEPIVIPVHPPGRVGERRFLLEFGVDNQKRLLLTAKDLREEKVLWQEKPLIDLR